MREAARMRILSCEVLADIRSAAWLESETHPECNLHQRHEMADICEKDNIERVWRVLGVCVAEIRMALKEILEPEIACEVHDLLERPSEWLFSFRRRLSAATAQLLKEKTHEFLVSRVMADRLGVLIPVSAQCWAERGADALLAIRGVAHTAAVMRPVQRRMWHL